MAELYGKYKKFGGINNFSKKNTILVDNLVTNSLYTNVIPRGMSEEAMLWSYDTTSNFEVYTRRKYAVNETRINSSIGDIAGNAVHISGLTINSDTVNLWPIYTVNTARYDGNYIENRNLQITEISGGLVHGEVSGNTIRPYTYSHIHGTMNLVSGEFAHVHGRGNRVLFEGVGTHVEGSGNSCDISYAHILGRDNDISAVFMNGEKDIIRVASNNQRMNKMDLPHIDIGTTTDNSGAGPPNTYINDSGVVINENRDNSETQSFKAITGLVQPQHLIYLCYIQSTNLQVKEPLFLFGCMLQMKLLF